MAPPPPTTPRDSSAVPVAILVVGADASTLGPLRTALAAPEIALHVAEADADPHDLVSKLRPNLIVLDDEIPEATLRRWAAVLSADSTPVLPLLWMGKSTDLVSSFGVPSLHPQAFVPAPWTGEILRAHVQRLLQTAAAAGPGETADGSTRSEPELSGLSVTDWQRVQEQVIQARAHNEPLACLRVAGATSATGPHFDGWLRRLVSRNLRNPDFVCPWAHGGCLVVLPNTYLPEALVVAERILREATAQQDDNASKRLNVGVALFPGTRTETLPHLLERCDDALEQARRDAVGRICVFQHQGYLYAPEIP